MNAYAQIIINADEADAIIETVVNARNGAQSTIEVGSTGIAIPPRDTFYLDPAKIEAAIESHRYIMRLFGHNV